jgi:hypothetical protein
LSAKERKKVRRELSAEAAIWAMPVSGRWVAWNSPVDRVPSHHLHAYGQTYAIDLVCSPYP